MVGKEDNVIRSCRTVLTLAGAPTFALFPPLLQLDMLPDATGFQTNRP
jgi:hypothetical protein